MSRPETPLWAEMMSRHGLVSRGSQHGFGVATWTGAGQGKKVLRPGLGVVTRPGNRVWQPGAQRATARGNSVVCTHDLGAVRAT